MGYVLDSLRVKSELVLLHTKQGNLWFCSALALFHNDTYSNEFKADRGRVNGIIQQEVEMQS